MNYLQYSLQNRLYRLTLQPPVKDWGLDADKDDQYGVDNQILSKQHNITVKSGQPSTHYATNAVHKTIMGMPSTFRTSLEKQGYKLDLPKNSKITLVEVMSLPMIKVELLKFDISEFCNDGESISDIKLIDIKQASGLIVTVGADLAEDCVMEMFVETKDVYTNSIFK